MTNLMGKLDDDFLDTVDKAKVCFDRLRGRDIPLSFKNAILYFSNAAKYIGILIDLDELENGTN